MSMYGFVVPWEMVNQAIVSLHSYRKKNPSWTFTVFYDDVLVRMKLEKVFDNLTFIQLDDACPVLALDYVLNETELEKAIFFDPKTLCNVPLMDIAEVDLGDQVVVMRPDRPFELSPLNDGYPRLDPSHLDRYMRSRSYFSLGVVVYNLTLLRTQITAKDLYANYTSLECLDRSMPKHYLNRVLDGVKKGLLPGKMNVKAEEALYHVFGPSQCLRHQVRLRRAIIANFSSSKAPWEETGKCDRLFIQIPYRMYHNAAVPVKDHLEPWFYQRVFNNVKKQLNRFGDFDKTFEEVYEVADL